MREKDLHGPATPLLLLLMVALTTAFMEYTEPSIATQLKEFDAQGRSGSGISYRELALLRRYSDHHRAEG